MTGEAGPAGGAASRRSALAGALAVFVANLAIVAKLFAVEYSAYTNSVDGTFIAIPRIMAKYPFQWSWWPFWNGGLPFETVYLPFSHWLVAAFILMTGVSAGSGFHIVTAAMFAVAPVGLYWMALRLSGRMVPSLIAALTSSCVSFSALLVPKVAADAGSPLHLRRLQNLVYYGESPHSAALALLPLAVLAFERALSTGSVKWRIATGVLTACVVLSNAFGIVALALAFLAWLLVQEGKPWWKPWITAAGIGALTYCWISPWLSPTMIRAIRANAPTNGGDYRYTSAAWIALAIALAGYAALWIAVRRLGAPRHVRFFVLLAYPSCAFMLAWNIWGIALIMQPSRYELQMDFFLPLALVFVAAWLGERLSASSRRVAATAMIVILAAQSLHAAIYGWGLIRSKPKAELSEYRVAQWLDRNRPGERAFVSGSQSFFFNAFTDTPQLHGGHDQHTINSFIPIVSFTVYSGMNAGDRDAEYSIFWLKTFGVQTVTVPGPDSGEFYKPFVHPQKFDGVLPLLWRDHGDSIYEIPNRSRSLAHVIPATAVVARRPIHGLDIDPVRPYVRALADPAYPPARFQWRNLSEAAIDANIEPGQVVSVQITYEKGWEAWSNARRQPIRGDAIGQLIIDPNCAGPCHIDLLYTGGAEHTAVRALSIFAMLAAAIALTTERRRKAVR